MLRGLYADVLIRLLIVTPVGCEVIEAVCIRGFQHPAAPLCSKQFQFRFWFHSNALILTSR
jgi:hypothetical protein